MRRAIVLSEARILSCLTDATFNHAAKIDARENAVVWNIMVHTCWLIVVIMSEAGSIGTAEVERHP